MNELLRVEKVRQVHALGQPLQNFSRNCGVVLMDAVSYVSP